jgi:arylsulfatase A-like enzyme
MNMPRRYSAHCLFVMSFWLLAGVFDKPVIQLDLHATALAVAGLEPKPEWKLEGVNLLPYLSGHETATSHDAIYWRFGRQMAIRSGDWKLVRYDPAADGVAGRVTPAE